MTIDPTSFVSAWTNDNFHFHSVERRYSPYPPNYEFRSIHLLINQYPEHVMTVMTHIMENLILDEGLFPFDPDLALESLKVIFKSKLDICIQEELRIKFCSIILSTFLKNN